MDDKNVINKKKGKSEDEIKNDNNLVDEKNKEIENLTDQLKRAIADYRNLERRSFEERTEAIKFANKNLIEQLLPAFDTLILAVKYTEDENIKMTLARVLEILKENGIEKILTLDEKYNADIMEVVEVVDGKEGQVVEELRPGFTLNGKLIRPAQVKVGKENNIN